MHEAVNAFMVAVVSAERNCRYINPNQAIEKLHPNFADQYSILSLRFENPARILQKLPYCVMRDKRYETYGENENRESAVIADFQ